MERQSLLFLSVLVVFSLACGLIEDEDTNVSYTEEITQSFPIDANKLCPQGQDCSKTSVPADKDRPLNAIELSKSVDVVAETGRQELRDYAGAFRSIEITRIDYTVEGNDLTFDLPPTKLYLGPMGATSKDDEGVVELATLPTVGAKQNISERLVVTEAATAASSDLFQNLELSTLLFAEPLVKKGQPFPPSGNAQLSLTIYVKFTANPQDAL